MIYFLSCKYLLYVYFPYFCNQKQPILPRLSCKKAGNRSYLPGFRLFFCTFCFTLSPSTPGSQRCTWYDNLFPDTIFHLLLVHRSFPV